MSGRMQTLMRTRCPVCATVFRATSEQLRLKAGTVRCGHCRAVFNAFDALMPDDPVIAAPLRAMPKDEAERPAVVADAPPAPADVSPPAEETLPEPDVMPETPEEAPLAKPVAADESIEQSTLAAREAGLVAARELTEAPDYNRWAAGAMVSEASIFAAEPARRALWPFVIVALLLALLLAAQLLLHFRTEVARWLPATAAYYELLGVAVPLSRNADLVVIDTSDLQSDQRRGQFVLHALLHNRAPYPQDWPALELSLTDAADQVVARRVMTAADYLPPTISPELFPANGEVAVRLWIETSGLAAAGYRLYIFYP